jgi:hypothetical protein
MYRRTLAEACPETIAEFADVERELQRVGLPVPPTSPMDTVTGRFLALLAQAADYDRACTAAAVSA